MSPAIVIEDLSHRYSKLDVPAVARLNLVVEPGEILGFVGPNGAGKTTTLSLLAGLLEPQEGRIEIAGAFLPGQGDLVRSRVGYLPDYFGVPDGLSCRQYLLFFAGLQGLPGDTAAGRIDELLELTQLTERADDLAEGLSRGLTQRLGLARVLLHDPAVLLLDEPASGLDPRSRVEIREVLIGLAERGKTIIVSSHVLADLAAACSSLAMIERGELLFRGSVEEALSAAERQRPAAVLVACLEGPDRTAAALAEHFSEEDLEEIDGGLLRVHVQRPETEGPRAVAWLGEQLDRAGLQPCHLELEPLDLERAFMTLTTGRLA
ncbi:MAG: ABC transporter ATP-binding protein [Acidobacteriota bacterium]